MTTTTTTTSTTTTTTTTTTTSTTTYTYQYGIGFVEGWRSTSSTTTTTQPTTGKPFKYQITRKSGLSYKTREFGYDTPTDPDGALIEMTLPTPISTDLDPFSLKTYADFDGNVGVFDGAGANRIDDGSSGTLLNFTVIAPQNAGSVSSTTSTTSTTTSTTTTTSTSTSTTTTSTTTV